MLSDVEKDLQAVTAELIEVQDQLLAMYGLASDLRGYLEPDTLLKALVIEAVRLLGAADGFAAMGDEDVRIITTPGLQLDPADSRRLVKMARKGTDVLVTTTPGVGRVMVVSIPLHDRPSAVLALVREAGSSFTAPEQKLMAAIGAYGGAQLEGVLLHQETLRRARVELEFELARSIQSDLSPAVPTGHPGVDVYAVSRPAHDVGGDFFDFTWGDDGRLVSMLGDVAGKGIPAALLVAMTRAIIRTSSRAMQGSNPGGVLGRANAELYQDFSQLGRFATVFLASFEPDSRRAVVANAGHSPVIYKGDGERPRLLQADAVPIGVIPDWESKDLTFRLGPKDLLIAATDGFSEAENPHTSELFGYERLLDLVDQVATRDAEEIANALFEATDAFSSGMEAGDDRTVVVLRGVE